MFKVNFLNEKYIWVGYPFVFEVEGEESGGQKVYNVNFDLADNFADIGLTGYTTELEANSAERFVTGTVLHKQEPITNRRNCDRQYCGRRCRVYGSAQVSILKILRSIFWLRNDTEKVQGKK